MKFTIEHRNIVTPFGEAFQGFMALDENGRVIYNGRKPICSDSKANCFAAATEYLKGFATQPTPLYKKVEIPDIKLGILGGVVAPNFGFLTRGI